MKSIAKEPWFGKKKAGYGVRPVSWPGRLVSVVFVLVLGGLLILSLINYRYIWIIEAIILVVIILFVSIVILTTDRPSIQ